MKLLIVNFHYIRDKKYQSGIYPRTLSELSNQIDSISKHYKFISQENLISQLLNKSISKNAKYCLLTFDDGLKEQMEAFKMLIKKGIPAVFFVNTKPIKNNTVADVHKLHHIRSKLCDEEILKLIKPIHKVDNFNYPSNINQLYRYDSTDAKKLKYLFNFGLEPEVKALVIKNIFNNYFDETSLSRELYMNGDDIITLSNSDALGTHGHTHLPLASLNSKELKKDIDDSINFFRDIGANKIRGISYPYGGVHSVSQSVFDACQMFDYGITMQRGINFFDSSMNKLALKRVDTNEAPGGKLNSEEYL